MPREKITTQDKLLLAFDALVLGTVSGEAPRFGKIIHGRKQATTKVDVAGWMDMAKTVVSKIAAQQANPTPPPLMLNQHCAACEFKARCRQIALEKDELSLLANMTAKERQQQHAKGIFSVTQLSYTFRARRKPKRFASKPEKYSHALRALALREGKIHIAGRPELHIHGNPVYLDVEGVPDRDFYYLIGLRIKSGDAYVHYAFWANELSEEQEIWAAFLQTLAKIDHPQLIHYGSYETTFLKRMKERYRDSGGASGLPRPADRGICECLVRDLRADLLPHLLKQPQRDRAIPGVSMVGERRIWITHAHVEITVGVLQGCGPETETGHVQCRRL